MSTIRHLYFSVARYNKIVGHLSREDVDQELALSLLQPGNMYRNASRNVARLAREYGFSRKMGVDKAYRFDDEGLRDEQEAALEKLYFLYVENNLTVKEICWLFNADYNNNIQKLFCKVFPKGLGRGGARKNAGRKKL